MLSVCDFTENRLQQNREKNNTIPYYKFVRTNDVVFVAEKTSEKNLFRKKGHRCAYNQLWRPQKSIFEPFYYIIKSILKRSFVSMHFDARKVCATIDVDMLIRFNSACGWIKVYSIAFNTIVNIYNLAKCSTITERMVRRHRLVTFDRKHMPSQPSIGVEHIFACENAIGTLLQLLRTESSWMNYTSVGSFAIQQFINDESKLIAITSWTLSVMYCRSTYE